MSKRIHELAKEWDVQPKDLVAGLGKLGIRGKRSQSSLTDEEVQRVREALGLVPRPTVAVGTERVVAERVVTERDAGGDHLVTAREQTTETRLRANVIRRRTAREVLKSEALPPPSSTDSASSEVPPALDLEASVPPSLAEVPPAALEPALPVEEPPPAAAAPPPAAAAPAPAAEQPLPPPPAAAAEPAAPSASSAAPAGRPRPARQVPGPVPAPPPPGFEEMRGVKVLGKIDLRKPTAPAPSPAARGAAPAPAPEAAAADGAPKKKKGRKVIKKSDMLDTMERDFLRPGKRPQKRRALPGKEQKKTEITVPRASKRVVRISEVITVADLARAMGVKAGDVLKKLLDMGMMATINQALAHDTAALVAAEFEHQVGNGVLHVEQTLEALEAINHARAAEVPIIVAINKIDKSDANPERVKQELGNHGLAPEEWGGDTIMVLVSAKTREGIAQLLDMILLQADVLELEANPGRLAKGTIVEARLDRGRGPVATVLVQEGTLRPGDAFVCGTQYGRVRAMMNDKGQRIEAAGPSTPVEILGLGGVPEAGDTFVGVQDDQKARQVAEHRRTKQREAEMAKTAKVSLDELYQQIQTGQVKELKVVLKADVQGSVEATSEALRALSSGDVRLTVLHGSVGGITESDVLLASASNAVVIGFNVRPEPKAAALAEREGEDIRLYTIIYEALNDVRDALEGLLEPTLQEKVLGRAEVRQTFTVSGIGQVAGCFVAEGKIPRGAKARLLRDHVVVHDGRIASLKRFKEDVREVAGGYECGMSLAR